MSFTLPVPTMLVLWFAALARLSGFIIAMPGLESSQVPARFKVGLVVMLSLVIMPVMPPAWQSLALETQGLGPRIAIVGAELALGLAIGLASRLMLEGILLAGSLLDRDLGFAMTESFDPTINAPATLCSSFFMQLFLVLFMITDRHHDLLRAAVLSFERLGPGAMLHDASPFGALGDVAGQIFVVAFQLALPIFTIILFTNIAMALMARFGQEFEVLMLSFPVRLLLGLFMLSAMIPVLIITILRISGDMPRWTLWFIH